MGVYLSSPVTEKESVDEECADFSYGASSMQGWRINQEDAHNCIPDFDPETKTSFFAVYDGHGGPEVAKYCERHFPEFVKMMIESQKENGNSDKIIKGAFLAFDSTLIQDEVIKELKVLAGKDDDDDEIDEDDPVGRTETDRLKEEADMPLDELLAKYGRPVEDVQCEIQGNKDDEAGCSKESPSSSKGGVYFSPALRAKGVSRTGSSQKEAIEKDSPSSTTAEMISNSDPSSSLSPSSSSSSFENNKTCVANSVSNGVEADVSASTKKGGKTSRVGDANGQTNNNNIDKSTSESNSSGAKNTSESSRAMDDSSDSALPESSSRKNEGCGSSSGSSSGSGSSLSQDQVSSSTNSTSAKPILDGDVSSTDDDDEEEDAMWQDMSDDSDDDDDDEEEDNDADQDVPQMDFTNEEPGSDSGCTACVCLLQGKKVIVANAGDSRCVLSRGGVAVELSFDHKPEDDPERERIEKAGGKVTSDGRVNGGLNLSRAIGDHVYKRNQELPAKDQMITSLPDIETAELTDDDQFIIIACDGIWNYMSSQEVVDYVLQKLKDPEKRKKPSLVCEELFDHCLAPNTYGDGTGCDNMTCIIVVLNSMKATDSTMSSGDATSTEIKPESLKRCADDSNAGLEKKLKQDDVA